MPSGSHVLFISRYFWPELIGPAPFSTDVAEWLAQHGRPTTVVSGLPQHPDMKVLAAYRDGRYRREVVGGATVERLRVGAPSRKSAGARFLNEVKFLVLGLAALASGRIERHPMVLALSPSILSVALGVVARRRGGVCVAIVHDVQSGPSENRDVAEGSVMTRVMRACERTVFNRTDLVVVLSPQMKDRLRRIGVSAPIEVVPLWIDADQVAMLRLADGARLRQELGRRGRESVGLSYAKPRILGEFMSRLDALAAQR
jgi:colanic acid biosynthesis glycosyl transferase WcaI